MAERCAHAQTRLAQTQLYVVAHTMLELHQSQAMSGIKRATASLLPCNSSLTTDNKNILTSAQHHQHHCRYCNCGCN